MTGLLVAIEGLDGSGGTTQTRLLSDWLRSRGRGVLVTREPSDLPVGLLIRDALRGRAPLGDAVLPYLFAADRRDHLDREILPGLARGEVVITDRYLASSLAYQSLVLDFDRVASLNADFLLPDLTVMLDLAPARCLERIGGRGAARERFEELEALEAVAAGYERALAWTAARGGPLLRVDGSLSPEAVAERIRDTLASHL